jgi:hypothetical protein
MPAMWEWPEEMGGSAAGPFDASFEAFLPPAARAAAERTCAFSWQDAAGAPAGAGAHAAAESRRPVNAPALRRADRDAFLRELAAERDASAALVRAVVRAFTVAALRSDAARAADGWREVFRAIRLVLGASIRDGVREVRLAGVGAPPPPPVPVEPPIPLWELAAHYRHTPTAAEVEANRAYWQGLPVRLVDALVRAHVAARLREPGGDTPEGRSRITAETRELLWDALLDAVKQVPPPRPARPRRAAARRAASSR